MEEETSFFNSLPLEIQAHIFSMSSLADVTSFALTCRYYQKEAWSFVVTLNPAMWQAIVVQSVEMSANVYIDDLFSEADPKLLELAKIKKAPIFHRIFSYIDKCSRRLEKFELNYEGFEDVKEDFLGAMERFPSFIQQVTALTLLNIPTSDATRLLMLATKLEKLDWKNKHCAVAYTPDRLDFGSNTRLTSLILRNFRQPSMKPITQILPSMTHLQSLDLIDWRHVRDLSGAWHYPSSLTRLGIINLPAAWPGFVDLLRCTLRTETGLGLKQLDLRGTRISGTRDKANVAPIKESLPNLEIIVGEYDYPIKQEDPVWLYVTIQNYHPLYNEPI